MRPAMGFARFRIFKHDVGIPGFELNFRQCLKKVARSVNGTAARADRQLIHRTVR